MLAISQTTLPSGFDIHHVSIAREGKTIPALAINWGPVSGGGMVPPSELDSLDALGIRPLPLASIADRLARVCGVPKAQAYNVTMYIMGGLFIIGFIANFMIKAVNQRFHMKSDHEAIRAQMAVDAAGEPAGA